MALFTERFADLITDYRSVPGGLHCPGSDFALVVAGMSGQVPVWVRRWFAGVLQPVFRCTWTLDCIGLSWPRPYLTLLVSYW